MWSALYSCQRKTGTDEDQGDVDILVVLPHVFGIVLERLLLVHGVEIKFGIVVLDGLEIHSQSLLDADGGIVSALQPTLRL